MDIKLKRKLLVLLRYIINGCGEAFRTRDDVQTDCDFDYSIVSKKSLTSTHRIQTISISSASLHQWLTPLS